MNNIIYISGNKKNRKKIPRFIQQFELTPCYIDKREVVLKCENLIMSLKQEYITLDILSPEKEVIAEVKNYFQA